MKYFILLLIIMISANIPVLATNWIEVSHKIYIDDDSVEPYINEYDIKENMKFIFWTKNLNDGSKPFKYWERKYNSKIWYVLQKEIIACQQKKISTITLVIYDLKENIIDRVEIPDFAIESESIIPDSIGELFYDGICK